MSITVANSAQVSLHSSNRSPTKQAWSFNKSERFDYMKNRLKTNGNYDIPTTLSRRGTSFGYGPRKNFAVNNGVPSPNSYQTKSDFCKNPGKNAFSFGIAREAYEKVYLKEHPSQAGKKSIPGPGSYKVNSIIGNDGRKFSFRPKTRDVNMFLLAKDSPGPGAYDFRASVNSKAMNFNSKFQSAPSCTFNKTKHGRFSTSQNPSKKSPGPGSYSPKLDMSKTGAYFYS